MPVQLINPPGLPRPETHAQVAVATGRRTIYLAGQVGQDANGGLAVGDLAAQTEQALVNVATGLRAAGAGFDDVAKVTIYAARWRPESMAALAEGWQRAAARLEMGSHRPPVTLIGVEILFTPEILVEFDVTAVVD